MRTQERVPSRCASSTPPVISFFPFCFLFRPNPFRFLLRPNPCTRRTRTPRTQHPIKGELKPSCRSTISCSSLRSRRHAPAARLHPRVPVSPRATTRCAVAPPLQVPASHLLAPLPLQAVPAQRRPDPFTPCPPAYTSLCAASAARRRASGLPRASLPACVLGLCAASPCSSTAPSLSWCSPLSSPASRTHRIGQEQNRPAGATSFAKFDLYDASPW
jgi:hypothetical protein